MKETIELDSETKRKYEEIFLRYYPKVKSFSMKLLKDGNDAEDIAQDVFVKVLYQFPYLSDLDNVDAYLFTMTRNQIFNFIRHRKIEHTYVEKLLNDYKNIPITDAYDQMDDKERLVLTFLSVETLPERRRKIFKMSRMQGLSNQEIADDLHLSVRTVESQIYKALKEIRSSLLLLSILFIV